MAGFLMLSREIQSHWIFDDPEKLKAWLVILMEVNFEAKKTQLKGHIFECGIGQSLYSLDTWASKFGKNWDKFKVKRFFDLLKKDEMILTENVTVTLRLTVCNYLKYNKPCNGTATVAQRHRNGSATVAQLTKEMNKGIREEEDLKPLPTQDYQQRLFAEFYLSYPKKKARVNAEKAWKKISPNESLFLDILTGLERAKNSFDWTKEKGKYIPYPASWLNAGGWEDEHEEEEVERPEHFRPHGSVNLPESYFKALEKATGIKR
jgi:hypothetical protein